MTDIVQDQGHWQFDGEFDFDAYGFVYLITNNISDKKYIGKKQMKKMRKLPPLKGKKRKRTKVVDSDWRTYTGSSDNLNDDIKTYGKNKFTFQILRFCNSKSALAYFETKEQFDKDVLLDESYYNGIINIRVGKIKL